MKKTLARRLLCMHNVIQGGITSLEKNIFHSISTTIKENAMQEKTTYMTTDELAARIKYDARTIRDQLKDSVLLEGKHYIRPFGGRKILYLWEAIEKDMFHHSKVESMMVPLASGGICHG